MININDYAELNDSTIIFVFSFGDILSIISLILLTNLSKINLVLRKDIRISNILKEGYLEGKISILELNF